MKINVQDEALYKKVGELKQGDIFSYDNKFWLKTDEVSDCQWKVVNLATGYTGSFGAGILVIPRPDLQLTNSK